MVKMKDYYSEIKHLTLVASCGDISPIKWERFMNNTKKANGSKIRKLIKKHIPSLYESLGLEFFNPYECQCRRKENLFVYVHSNIEYFLEF